MLLKFILMNPFNFYELLSILELQYLPTKEELKRQYKELLKKYHPDTCKLKKAHEKTIQIKQAYEMISTNYEYYYQQYINLISKKNESQKEISKLQVYYNNKLYLGFPLYGLKTFLGKEEAKIVHKNFNYYINFNNNLYKIIMLEEIQEPFLKDFYYFVIYELEELFAIYILEKLKFIQTIEIQNNITWNYKYGRLEYFSMTILIPSIFQKILMKNYDAVFTYQ